ncbi:MAG: S8 family serine peptidase [Thermomicrobiales bacterium]|nr:S8 family serine peptidase [Thermomicrobiales bacterium]
MPRGVVLVSVVVLVASLFAALTPTPTSARSSQAEYVSGELLVKFRKGTDSKLMTDAHRNARGVLKRSISKVGVDVVAVTPGQESARIADYLRNPNVEFAERNGIYSAVATPNDPRVSEQWHLENGGQGSGIADSDIDAYAAWDVTSGSVAIAILDTGIDTSHPDLSGKISKSVNFSSSPSALDVNGHGTHVAGIVAARTGNGVGVAGVCPGCTIFNVKVLADNGNGSWAGIVEGIYWAVDNGAKVINMSLGGTASSSSLSSAINYAWSRGVVVVAAAGNESSTSAFYPAYLPNVIAVASTNNRDQKSSFSNYGTWVSVAAPGESILSTVRGTSYGLKSGTSMASPVVAGLAGLVWSTPYGTSNTAVRNRIEQTSEAISGTGSRWLNGRVNACKAVGGVCDGVAGGPEVTLVSPREGAVLTADGSTQRLQLRAVDPTTPEGSLNVQFRIDGGSWNAATYNTSRQLYEWNWGLDGVSVGSHQVEARATNGSGGSTLSAPSGVRVTHQFALPGSFEAEDYHRYFDTTAGNSGGAYWVDDVDKTTCADGSGCISVTDIESAEWLSYKVSVPAAGDYVFTFRTATPRTNATLTVLVDDVDVSGAVSIQPTGGWSTWGDTTSAAIRLQSGAQIVKFLFGHTGTNPGSLLNLNRVSVALAGDPIPSEPTDAPPTVAITSPTHGTTIVGSASLVASADDDNGLTQVEFFVDGASVGKDTSSAGGWAVSWNSAAVADGSHVLTAVATDSADQTTISAAVTVNVDNINELPVPQLGATCNELACSFNSNGSADPDGQIVSYAWTFGDGGTAVGPSATHVYGGSGSFTVTLTVTDNRGGTATKSQSVNVTAAPPPPPPPSTLNIADLDGKLTSSRSGASVTITIQVESSTGVAVANATVTGTVSYGRSSKTLSCQTSSSGVCTVSIPSLTPNATVVTFEVTNVTHATLAYAPANNHDPDRDSDGTTITLR